MRRRCWRRPAWMRACWRWIATREALELARAALAPFGDRVILERANFSELAEVAARHGIRERARHLAGSGRFVHAARSRRSADSASMRDSPLDMRMDDRQELTAARLLKRLPQAELADVLWRYGEEPMSRRIAKAVAEARARGEALETTAQLAELVSRAKGGRRGRTHPATQTFQALRIAVNGELAALETALPAALDLLAPGGRLAVISFHSLEDRRVKQFMAAHEGRHGIAGERRLALDRPVAAGAPGDAQGGHRHGRRDGEEPAGAHRRSCGCWKGWREMARRNRKNGHEGNRMMFWGISLSVRGGRPGDGLSEPLQHLRNHRPADQEAGARAGRTAQAGGERGAQLGHGPLDRQHGAADGRTTASSMTWPARAEHHPPARGGAGRTGPIRVPRRIRRGVIDRGYIWRVTLVAVALLAVWGGLAVRLGYLHLGANETLKDRVRKMRTVEEKILVGRGRILDRNEQLLALDLPVQNIMRGSGRRC